MSDYEDYNDDDIEYNSDPGDYDNGDGLNLEDNFIEAENSPDPISAYKQIIELEISNSSDHKWSYKSYEKLSEIYIKARNFPDFKESFSKLLELYDKVDECDRSDTVRNISDCLIDVTEFDFKKKVFVEMVAQLKDKGIEKTYLEAGVQWSKVLFGLNKYDELRVLVPELLKNLNKMKEDEMLKGVKLELLVMKIQLCKVDNKLSEIKSLYFEATKLMENQIFDDKRLSGIINEEGGKINMRQQEYEAALQKFKLAFHNYQEVGNSQSIAVLKYAFLASMMTRDSSIIVTTEEAKLYRSDELLNNIVLLFEAYEKKDINLINKIWSEKIVPKEKDPFFLEHINDILYNIRLNYIIEKLRTYKVCSFETLEKELGIPRKIIVGMLFQIAKLATDIDLKINLIENNVEIFKKKSETLGGDLVSNYNFWMRTLFK